MLNNPTSFLLQGGYQAYLSEWTKNYLIAYTIEGFDRDLRMLMRRSHID